MTGASALSGYVTPLCLSPHLCNRVKETPPGRAVEKLDEIIGEALSRCRSTNSFYGTKHRDSSCL